MPKSFALTSKVEYIHEIFKVIFNKKSITSPLGSRKYHIHFSEEKKYFNKITIPPCQPFT